jgi:Na+-driven multidrug efflux pump
VKLGAIIFGILGAVIFTWAPNVMRVFSDADVVIEAGTNPLRLVSALGPIIAFGMILTQALFGAGDTRYVMTVEVILHFVCLVPCAWLFGITLRGGLIGVWMSAGLYALLLTTFMAVRFARGRWKTLQV